VDIRTVSKSFICLISGKTGLTFVLPKHGKASGASLLRRSENDLTRGGMMTQSRD
jgi:hypothetical protein